MRVSRSIIMASPKLFVMNATWRLSGEMSARSPKWVRTSMLGGQVVELAAGLALGGKRQDEDEQGTQMFHVGNSSMTPSRLWLILITNALTRCCEWRSPQVYLMRT